MDIKKGFIVEFKDGSRKTVKTVRDSGHVAVFDDGAIRDLSIIKNSIYACYPPANYEEVKEKPKAVIWTNDEPKQEAKSNINITAMTYSDLFNMMERADHSELKYSKFFWHYCTLSNLVAILKSGKFQSRYDIEGSIPYDNKLHNPTSRDVMFNNLSWKTKTHVRFYLRPLNKPYFSLYKNLPDLEKALYCVIRIKKEALFASHKSTFLYYQTANKATDDVYDKSNELNKKYKSRFRVNNIDKFNFEETYSVYDSSQSDERSLYQEAEFLVWKELSTIFIDKIIFRTELGLNTFLEKIKNLSDYNDIKNKCLVDWRYFGYRD